MSRISRRSLLAGSVAALAAPAALRAEAGKPKVTVISQWSAGSDGLAITTLGKRFEQEGGVWEHNPVPGFTTEMMNKLRAQIIAGDPPAASQLKGPEIAAWSKIGAVVDLDAQVKDGRIRSRGASGTGASQQALWPLDRAADPGLSHQHAVHLEEGGGHASASASCPPPGPSSTPWPRR